MGTRIHTTNGEQHQYGPANSRRRTGCFSPGYTGQGSSRFALERYPDFVQIARGYGCGAATVSKKADLTAALEEMIAYDGPYVLDVEVPYQEQVLPMIPSGHTVDDMILE